MRDPRRIDSMLMKIGEIWKKNPDLRLNQLLSNAASRAKWSDNDLFYLEDDKLLVGLNEMIAEDE